MIEKQHLQNQLASLEQQREQAVGQVHQIEGAARLCRTLLGKIEREEHEAAKAAEANAALDVEA